MAIEIPQTLLTDISKGRASLFLGAGASREAGFPSAEDLSKHLATQAGPSHSTMLTGQPLDAVAQHLYLQAGYGKHWVRKQVIDLFDSKLRDIKRTPSQAHETMTKIRWRTIFTTNYDRLVEISYDSSPDCVQRSLPIYASDPQILRHEADVVRIIKLNGSIDEAARNSKHELVLTFLEQRDAYSRNKDFYSLLREEAINGPIIFVGFRFVHPGASISGSSPEFQQLRDLLHEMGSAARWHYCVTPYDPSSPTAIMDFDILRANQVAVINATFSEFLDSLSQQLQTSTLSLAKRPPIVIPVGQKNIKIDSEEYEKDKRHFEILGTFLEELNPPSVKESLNGHETWASFLHEHFIKRLCKNDLRTLLINSVQNAPEILLLSAPPGWGKTFQLRELAADCYRSGRPIIWLNPHSTLEVDGGGENPVTLGKWDSLRIDHIISMITEATIRLSLTIEEATPIIIADNCPERAREVLTLFRDLTNNNRSFVLVFAVRDNELDSLLEDYPLFQKCRRFQPEGLYDSKEEVRTLIDFCTHHSIATIEDATQREIVAQNIIREDADTSLILALQVIFDKNHRPFSEIVKDFWRSLPDEDSQKLVLRVASLHRFGSAFSPRLYSLLKTFSSHTQGQLLTIYRECLAQGVLFERIDEEEPCVYTLHSLVAEHIIRVSGRSAAEIDDELIRVLECMTSNTRDLEIIRRMLKLITDYQINLASEEKTLKFLEVAAVATNADWVICQQIAKYLVQRGVYELALAWVERALETNPDSAPLHHTKGNVLRRWGMQSLTDGKVEHAHEKFEEARQCFAVSRVKREADEYGYVTHLDMIRYLLEKEQNKFHRANLLAEGVQLYNEGLRSVPKDQFRFLLEERFQRNFVLNEMQTVDLCAKIEKALADGNASVYAAVFLASQLYLKGKYESAIEALHKQRKVNEKGILTWVKEAELNARIGQYQQAAQCIDSARRRENVAENSEALWSLMYWNVLVATAREDFQEAREASLRLTNSGFFSRLFSRQFFPRGYIWKEAAREIKPEKRSFKEHAKIWAGRIERIRAGDSYGQIALTNIAGETFNLDFTPRYFSRGDLRRGDRVEFIITILPNRLRADDVNSKPFLNTIDDLFVK